MAQVKITTESFIKRSINTHNNKYSYDRTVFNGLKCEVTITCPVHGDFVRPAGTHLYQKRGCPKCKPSRKRVSGENFSFPIQIRKVINDLMIVTKIPNGGTDYAANILSKIDPGTMRKYTELLPDMRIAVQSLEILASVIRDASRKKRRKL